MESKLALSNDESLDKLIEDELEAQYLIGAEDLILAEHDSLELANMTDIDIVKNRESFFKLYDSQIIP